MLQAEAMLGERASRPLAIFQRRETSRAAAFKFVAAKSDAAARYGLPVARLPWHWNGK
ncbi:hypothetical protein FP2506_07956 [Fulvimarina pelagi HTCC2506]|uniref:Uncharacterized protein n=1 Tax=Fulvimarina pelagi HTCC2506 TaxID=314231 RepID=Q0G6F5_9HYPH|nr:hypothetical protein FP2506_07956 [Fulvimarina pelagi HTCC2506]